MGGGVRGVTCSLVYAVPEEEPCSTSLPPLSAVVPSTLSAAAGSITASDHKKMSVHTHAHVYTFM